ncbi:glycosyltransferase family 31 protein [Baudoinia panamericana UAMH 10762]|uniref:N-acetylgalactosaminide beta-1,3-galactosyltransferase n=1 Tax=Baudoinia panamericana (strain UAMH 10762) TaxID=717646 RepID=M2MU30_BAUPA|nr:glycosyltransferase family 31 protein [Baudoinia panamericana UAMH 10762]EMC95053.1 glycosyltransferase family 31 protein [Baudoinia panamericana UAMH 10762]
MISSLGFSFRPLVLVTAAAFIFFFLSLTHVSPVRPWTASLWQPSLRLTGQAQETDPNAPLCRHLAGAEDVVVVMRTGATEIQNKLPVHLRTTFKCYPDTLIFSDYAEVFEGHQVYDVLVDVDHRIREVHPDFEHYHRLQELGRLGLEDHELHSESIESGPVGKNDNPGWRLDKWKFLPMIVRTLELRPNQKWYVFVEPDTYLVWTNLIQWLQTLNPGRASYYGSEVQIGNDIFAHGGSAFVLSNAAMNKAADIYTAHPDEWHSRTAQHWAGDCILGTALKQAGVKLTWAWPMFQGGNPTYMKWNDSKPEKQVWCTPALSYHHFLADEVERMWTFEQHRLRGLLSRIARPPSSSSSWRREESVMYHSDVFKQFILPDIPTERMAWSNMPPDDNLPHIPQLSMDACRRVCEVNDQCVQYSAGPDGCSVTNMANLGHAAEGMESAWMSDRIETWLYEMDKCRRRGWIHW